jgi:hypothetical protein
VLNDALRKGRPEIFDTAPGAQFTSAQLRTSWEPPACVSLSTAAGAGWTISSSSACGGSLKSEEVYPKPYANGLKACIGISQWFRFYNEGQLNQACATRLRQLCGLPR